MSVATPLFRGKRLDTLLSIDGEGSRLEGVQHQIGPKHHKMHFLSHFKATFRGQHFFQGLHGGVKKCRPPFPPVPTYVCSRVFFVFLDEIAEFGVAKKVSDEDLPDPWSTKISMGKAAIHSACVM